MALTNHKLAIETARVIYVVDERSNPSTDYFVLPAVSSSGKRIIRSGFNDLPEIENLKGALVIFVRYVPADWANMISKVRHSMAGLIFFMDDDVLDIRASSGMPLRYRFKLARLAAFKKSWLKRFEAQLWVSTPYLKNKYEHWQPELVLPAPLELKLDIRRVFYHASASHMAEIRWLYSVMKEVLHQNDDIAFEIIGGEDVYRLYRKLPRVNVVHPMKWDAYNAFLGLRGRHIGLAPLLKSPFNSARSYTKFFDITRCGAAGIYSAASESAKVIDDEIDGLIVDMDKACWVNAILRMADDEQLREFIVKNAETKLVVLKEPVENELYIR